MTAIPALNMSQPRLFRTYQVNTNQNYNCTIWEAARATSAVPKIFKHISIGEPDMKEIFLGASLGWNNPLAQVLDEAERVYGASIRVACILSIGAGHPETIAWQSPETFRWLSTDLLTLLRQISTNCEDSAEQFENRYKNVMGLYFRLSVEQGMQKVALADWQKLGEIKTHTTQYLLRSGMSKKVDLIAQALCAGAGLASVGELSM